MFVKNLDIPNHILVSVMMHLDLEELLSIRATSKELLKLSTNDVIWIPIVSRYLATEPCLSKSTYERYFFKNFSVFVKIRPLLELTRDRVYTRVLTKVKIIKPKKYISLEEAIELTVIHGLDVVFKRLLSKYKQFTFSNTINIERLSEFDKKNLISSNYTRLLQLSIQIKNSIILQGLLEHIGIEYSECLFMGGSQKFVKRAVKNMSFANLYVRYFQYNHKQNENFIVPPIIFALERHNYTMADFFLSAFAEKLSNIEVFKYCAKSLFIDKIVNSGVIKYLLDNYRMHIVSITNIVIHNQQLEVLDYIIRYDYIDVNTIFDDDKSLLILIICMFSKHPFYRDTVRDPVACKKIITLLIDKGVSLDACNAHGCNVLHYAIDYSLCLDALEEIIKNTQAINKKDTHGDTPLHYLISLRADLDFKVKTLQLLVANGANVDEVNETNTTALHLAIYIGVNSQIVELLLGFNANTAISSQLYGTPFELAKLKHKEQIKKGNSDPNAENIFTLLSSYQPQKEQSAVNHDNDYSKMKKRYKKLKTKNRHLKQVIKNKDNDLAKKDMIIMKQQEITSRLLMKFHPIFSKKDASQQNSDALKIKEKIITRRNSIG